MSMQYIKCPYCHKSIGPVAINDKINMSPVHRTCSKCHKSFYWQGIYGKVKVMKE